MRALPLVGILVALWLMVGRDGVSDIRTRIRSIEALRPYQPVQMCGTGGLQWSYRVSPEVAGQVDRELSAKGWTAREGRLGFRNVDQKGLVSISENREEEATRVTVTFGL